MTIDTRTWNRGFGLFTALFISTAVTAVYTGLWALIAIPFAVLFFYAGWQWKHLAFYFLVFSLPFSFEYQFTPGLGTDIPDEILMLLVSYLFLAAWIHSPGILPGQTLKHPLVITLLVSLGWTLLTVFCSSQPAVSLKFWLAKSWYAGAFVMAPLILFRKKETLLTAVKWLAIAMAGVTLIILLRHAQTGFSFATVNKSVTPFFRNHVNYSAMLVCLIPVFIAFLFHTPRKETRLLLAVVLAALLTALLFSYARGAWLALLTGLLAAWLIRKKRLLAFFALAILLTVSLFFWLRAGDRYLRYAPDYRTTIFHENFNEHLVATYTLKDVSTAERFYRWIAGVRMIRDNWLTGYGPNTFYEHYKGYAVPAYKTWVSDNPDHSTVHNYYLLTTIEQGLPGLIILLVLAGMMLYYAQVLYHRAGDHFYRGVSLATGVVVSMLLVLNFLSDLVETDKIGSLFFLCLSVLVITDMNTRKKGSDPAPDIERIA